MDYFDIYCELLGELDGELKTEEPLARRTTYGIGGKADLFIEAASVDDLKLCLDVMNRAKYPYFFLGKGSNLLVSDEGFHGAIITLGAAFKHCTFDEEKPHATAGGSCNLSQLVQGAFMRGLGGLEFAVGIPGTVGAAVFGNVGSRVDWISSAVDSVTTCSARGEKVYSKDDIEWSYRSSSIPKDEIVISAEFNLDEGDGDAIRTIMDANLTRRRDTQPLNYPNAGSVFRNPRCDSAGRLIEACGLKGVRVGGAEISPKHANFIVNVEHASASDVRTLIELAQEKVLENFNVELTLEIKFLGFDD